MTDPKHLVGGFVGGRNHESAIREIQEELPACHLCYLRNARQQFAKKSRLLQLKIRLVAFYMGENPYMVTDLAERGGRRMWHYLWMRTWFVVTDPLYYHLVYRPKQWWGKLRG